MCAAPDDTPGPNAYDPMEPQAHWKQGVFPNRPATKSRAADVDSSAEPTQRKVLAPSNKANVQQPSTATAKSTAKLEERLAKATRQIEDLQHDKAKAQNENSDLATELRLAAQREAKLKLALEKWEKNGSSLKEKNSKLSSLETRLGELQKVHEESKAKRQRENHELQQQLDAEKEKRKQSETKSQAELEALRQRLDKADRQLEAREQSLQDAHKEAQQLADQLDTLTEQNSIIQRENTKQDLRAKEQLKALRQELDQARSEAESVRAESQAKRSAETSALSAQLAEQQAALQEADQERQQLQQELDTADEEAQLAADELEHNLTVLARAAGQAVQAVKDEAAAKQADLIEQLFASRNRVIELETLVNERMAQIQELVAVVKQVQEDRDGAKQLAASSIDDLDQMLEERAQDRMVAAADDKDVYEQLGRIDKLEFEAQEANANLRAAGIKLVELRSQLQASQAESASRQAQIEALTNQMGKSEASQAEIQAAQEAAAEAKRELKVQQEANRSMSSALSNARVAEQASKDERDRMAQMLGEASKYEALYTELCQQTRHLLERHALAEEEKASLSALNASLLSHTNPFQKIMYMDRIRRELDDVKQENVTIKLQLEEAEARAADYETELRSYKAIDAPLSMRPRASVTRIHRAHTHALAMSMPAAAQKSRASTSSLLRASTSSSPAPAPASAPAMATAKPKIPRPRQSGNIGKARRVSIVEASSPDQSVLGGGYGVTHSTPAARRKSHFGPARRAPLEMIPAEEEWLDENEMTLDELAP